MKNGRAGGAHRNLKSTKHFLNMLSKNKGTTLQGLSRPRGFQEVEGPRFQDNRIMKVVRLLVEITGCLYPQGISPVLISVTGWVDPRAIVLPERLCQWKIPMIPSGIETATFRLVARCLNQLRYSVRSKYAVTPLKYRLPTWRLRTTKPLWLRYSNHRLVKCGLSTSEWFSQRPLDRRGTCDNKTSPTLTATQYRVNYAFAKRKLSSFINLICWFAFPITTSLIRIFIIPHDKEKQQGQSPRKYCKKIRQ
jgi:hypothetical protein